MQNNKGALKISLIAIGLGILVGIIILVVSGYNPLTLLDSLLRGLIGSTTANITKINLRNTGEFIVAALPIILTGLSVAFAFKTGLFNIGAEGQVMVGACASIVVAILIPMPQVIHAIVAIIAGAIAGALWGFIPGFLKSRFNVHEVVVCIMLNYFGLYLSNYILKLLPGSNVSKTETIPTTASLSSDFLSSITNYSRLNWGIIVVVIGVVLYWFILNKTSFGFSLRATGFNKNAAKYAGMKVKRNIIYSMMIAGAFSGLAGAIISLGVFNSGRVLNAFENYGFDGIAVAFVGAFNAVGIVLAGLLFGLLNVVAPLMQSIGIPKEISQIISAVIVLFVAMQYGIKYVLNKISDRKLANQEKVIESKEDE